MAKYIVFGEIVTIPNEIVNLYESTGLQFSNSLCEYFLASSGRENYQLLSSKEMIKEIIIGIQDELSAYKKGRELQEILIEKGLMG